jgi:histidinol-phosphate aminotransferase
MTTPLTRRKALGLGALAAAGFAVRSAGSPTSEPGTADRTPASAPAGPIRLHSNENPLGPSPAARRAMQAAFDQGCRYPYAAYTELEEAIAEREGLTPEHVVLGAGSHEVLRMTAMAYGLEDGEIVTGYPTYEGLESYAATIGAAVARVPLDDELQLDLEAIEGRVTPATGLVYLCNPNNPTGSLLPSGAVRSFCQAVAPRATVLVDEAYHELVEAPGYSSMVPLVAAGENVIVSRTFSKVHGLAGLRVGYGLAPPAIARRLQDFRTGAGVNVLGVAAALASHRDEDFVRQSRHANAAAREYTVGVLTRAGHRCLPSHTNFVFFRLGSDSGRDAGTFRQRMSERGILVGRPFPPLTDWCRLSLGTLEEMKRFATVFEALVV